MRALVWFRSDLRVRDNEALYHACKEARSGVVAAFAICARQWVEHDWGGMKVDFVLRNVRALSESLEKLNIPLLIVRASQFKTLPHKLLSLAKKHECDALFFNSDYEVNEQRRDAEVKALFERHGLPVHTFRDQLILDVARMRTGTGGAYMVFTPFKRKWLELLKAESPPRIHGKPLRQPRVSVQPDDVPDTLRGFAGRDKQHLWPEGEAVARQRLRKFVSQRIERYHELRDMPAVDGTSTLSPYLAAGVLSPRQCLHAAMEANRGRAGSGKKGVITWISELIWREFYRQIVIALPQVCMNRPFRLETDRLPWRYDEDQFEAWRTGHTGVPVVDAGRPVGTVSIRDVGRVAPQNLGTTRVADVMAPLSAESTLAPRDDIAVAMDRMASSGCGRLPVIEDGRLVGIVTRRDIMDRIRVRAGAPHQ